MPDLDVPTAVRDLLDRSSTLAAAGEQPALSTAEPYLVDLTAPPRRNRRVLAAAAALVAVAAVGGALAVGASSEGTTEGTALAQAPGTSAPAPVTTPDVTDPMWAAMDWPHLRIEVLGPSDVVDSSPVRYTGDLGPAGITFFRVATAANHPDSGEDAWGGAVTTASGEPAALLGTGADRVVEVRAEGLVIMLSGMDERVSDEDLAAAVRELDLTLVDP